MKISKELQEIIDWLKAKNYVITQEPYKGSSVKIIAEYKDTMFEIISDGSWTMEVQKYENEICVAGNYIYFLDDFIKFTEEIK